MVLTDFMTRGASLGKGPVFLFPLKFSAYLGVEGGGCTVILPHGSQEKLSRFSWQSMVHFTHSSGASNFLSRISQIDGMEHFFFKGGKVI